MFPETETLLTLERKYGDSLNFEDLHGHPGKPKKKKLLDDAQSMGQSHMSLTGAGARSISGGSLEDKAAQDKFIEDQERRRKQKEDEKRKADTDCRNEAFEFSLKQRHSAAQLDFQQKNKKVLREMSQGRPPKERLIIPDDVDVFFYGNQKLNIWEVQKEELRQKIAKDPTNFYTYSKEYLSQSFPLVNENEIAVKEKEENEARWKTKAGFDNVMKRQNWNEHPKRPDQSTIENLKIPYHLQVLETK